MRTSASSFIISRCFRNVSWASLTSRKISHAFSAVRSACVRAHSVNLFSQSLPCLPPTFCIFLHIPPSLPSPSLPPPLPPFSLPCSVSPAPSTLPPSSPSSQGSYWEIDPTPLEESSDSISLSGFPRKRKSSDRVSTIRACIWPICMTSWTM